jgi:hypothetical protein
VIGRVVGGGFFVFFFFFFFFLNIYFLELECLLLLDGLFPILLF